MNDSKTGTLYGLGVGPGDPELITIKAARILAEVDVIAYPAPDTGESLARAIAAPHIPGGRTEIAIVTPMVPGKFPAHDVYDRYAAEIAGHLDAGRDVALLCEGDPFLYGSFMYVFARLDAGYPVEVVPGVSSLGACAAAAGAPLVSRHQVLTVLPATLDDAELRRRIGDSQAAAVMKVGRHVDRVRTVLEQLGRIGDAWYVERATMDNQQVMPFADFAGDSAPYFSMVLVRHSEGEAG
ncbi:MAG: precorrin-2 C(20)-methyltransferase [Rhodospirillales bacterium]